MSDKYYKGYTKEQVESMSNGCGAQSGLFKWLKPPHATFFKDQCNLHDVDYHIGGSEKERKQSDKDLKNRMVEKIKATNTDILIDELYGDECGIPDIALKFLPRVVAVSIFTNWARLYCLALSFGGATAFNYNK